MKLSYRGVSYEKRIINPLLENPEAIAAAPQSQEILPRPIYPRHLTPNLPNGDRRQSTSNPPGYSDQDRLNLCPTLNFYQRQPEEGLAQTAQLHLENLRQNLQKRLKAAKQAGDESLVHLLEQEFQQLSIN